MVVDYQSLGPVERCLQRRPAVARVTFLACAGNMMQYVGGTIDPPDAVAFAERDPNRIRVDG